MTKKEIILNTTWDEFEMGTCRLFVDVLNQYIPVVFFQDHKPTPNISNKMVQSINDIRALDENELGIIKEMLHEGYLFASNTTGESNTSKEEVYEKSKVKEIHIDQDNDKFDGVYSEVIITSISNHLISIIVKDGKAKCYDNGTYFDSLEEDHSKNS